MRGKKKVVENIKYERNQIYLRRSEFHDRLFDQVRLLEKDLYVQNPKLLSLMSDYKNV